ncbi:hypothetical protein MLD38_015282 [Melastoma candidum]|uniref:Uncharacterized protein n=1 Tax=Melastoma candidum TaxID=119954 RepID=A0ACB9RFM7_9MYRT|nr:hypothetical protein MLD38_015282 [Melastoma candidum]
MRCWGSKFLWDYMMFLVAEQSDLLSLITIEIMFQAAYFKIKKLQKLDSNRETKARPILSSRVPLQQTGSEPISKWYNIEGTQRIVTALREVLDLEKVITSVWIEMLCYASYNCQLYQHGGGILTHAWLLLPHSTDKFNPLPRQQTRPVAVPSERNSLNLL